MTKALSKSPASLVRSPLADDRLRQLWPGIEASQTRSRLRSKRMRRAGAACLALSIAALAVLARKTFEADHPLVQSAPVASTSDGAAQRLSLSDGSTLSLESGTLATVVTMRPDEIRVRLEEGSVECEVTKIAGRKFVVEAGALEVIVRGTHFTVAMSLDDGSQKTASVSVQRGLVEVSDSSGRTLALLSAGQRWSGIADTKPAIVTADAGTPASQTADEKPVPMAAPQPCETCKARPAPLESHAKSNEATAKVLFERGRDARVAGKMENAAAAFEQLLKRYPDDSRAGYAAFMLGRIRLDSFNDAKGAVEALKFAVAHPLGGLPVEDAETRLIEALRKAGLLDECRRRRDRFLKNYPRSASALLVAEECKGR